MDEEEEKPTKSTPKIIPSLNPVKTPETKAEPPKKSGFTGFSFGAPKTEEKKSEDTAKITPFSFNFSAKPQNNSTSDEKPKPFSFGSTSTNNNTSPQERSTCVLGSEKGTDVILFGNGGSKIRARTVNQKKLVKAISKVPILY